MADGGFAGMLRAEWFKIVRRRMTWIMAGLLVGLTFLVYVALTIGAAGGSAADADQATIDQLEALVSVEAIPPFGDDIVWQLVSIMGVILVSSMVGNEFSWRTIITLTVWTGDRVRIMLAKLLVGSALTALAVVTGFVMCFVSAAGLGLARGTFSGDQLTGALLGDIGVAVLTTLATALPYVFLSAAITVAGRSAALGISVGLAWLFLEGLGVFVIDALGESFGWAKNLLMNWNVQAVLGANGYVEAAGGAPPDGLPSAWQGVAILCVFMASSIAASALMLSRRDINE